MNWNEYFEHIHDKLINFGVSDFLFILISVFMLYLTFYILIHNNAKWLIPVFSGIIILILTFVVTDTIKNGLNDRVVFKYLLILVLLTTVLIFHSEIKRDIWRINIKAQDVSHARTENISHEEINIIISEIVKAVQAMAKSNTGALLVISKGKVPSHITSSGTILESKISSQLLESVFNTHTPLHDGAIVIESNKIIAAGCFLPLSQALNLPKDLGTRHRAALGLTEVSDATVIVVSEETGIISFAEDGKLTRYVDGEMLTKKLEQIYGLDVKVMSKKAGRRKQL